MFHHHGGELKCTSREDHRKTSVECRYHGECPVTRFKHQQVKQDINNNYYGNAKATRVSFFLYVPSMYIVTDNLTSLNLCR